MRSKLIIYCLAFSLSFCSTERARNETNVALVSWESELVMADGELANDYYKNRGEFIKPYVKKMYSGDTLRVETLQEINSCAETIGDIRFANDSLWLLTKVITEDICASVEFHKFKYVVVKKDIENYVIVF